MRHKTILRNNSVAFSKTNKTLSHSFKIAMNFKKGKHKVSQTCNQKKGKRSQPKEMKKIKEKKYISRLKEGSE